MPVRQYYLLHTYLSMASISSYSLNWYVLLSLMLEVTGWDTRYPQVQHIHLLGVFVTYECIFMQNCCKKHMSTWQLVIFEWPRVIAIFSEFVLASSGLKVTNFFSTVNAACSFLFVCSLIRLRKLRVPKVNLNK